MADVVLKVDGKDYGGWKSFQVERSIERGAGSFQLSVSERFPGQPKVWAIKPDAECVLLLDGQTAITGYVDAVDRSLSASDRGVMVRGRDRTADLVDCSAEKPGGGTGELINQSLKAICTMLAKPYGVGVVIAPGLEDKPFAKWTIEPGETIWTTIERAARQRGILLMSNGLGNLVLGRAGTASMGAALVEGENILSATLTLDNSQRYRTYLGLGQGTSNAWGDASAAAHISSTVTDKGIKRDRKHILSIEDLADGVTAEQRVTFERNVRRGRGRSLSVTVQGFTTAAGRLWQPNFMVPVSIPTLGIDDRLLIVGVTNKQDESGSLTEITLAPRSAYELLPEKSDDDTDNPMVDWGAQ